MQSNTYKKTFDKNVIGGKPEYKNMKAEESEQLFEYYLKLHGFEYQRDFAVDQGNINSANVDFRVESNSQVVLCDVKEVRDSNHDINGDLNAYTHIRNDINKLRKKFGKNKPKEPCVLVSMNFSSKFFTGLTIAKAMLGDIGICFDKQTKQIISDIHHLPRGNARMTQQQNHSISGVFVFDRIDNSHCLFTNPFADHPAPNGFFPAVQVVLLTRESLSSELQRLSDLMFWNVCDED